MEKGGVQRARVEQYAGPGRRRFVEARRERSQVAGTLRVKNTHTEHTFLNSPTRRVSPCFMESGGRGRGHAESDVIA